ncbi:MAG: zf-TFIIB domain-containing protein [bacterium]
MECVNCNEPLVVLELQQVELDYCLSCGGIWLDTGELGLLLGEERLARELLAPFLTQGSSKPGDRKCPICTERMQTVTTTAPAVELDLCEQGHGIWFDRGELHEIVRIIGGESGNKVATLLEDMFRSEM